MADHSEFLQWHVHPAQNHIDVASGGSFLSLNVNAVKALIEKIASNQSWKGERQQ
jgi:hypothetical protein